MNGITGNRHRGMTLIEVLVALLVLGIGVMGYAALQLNAVRMSEDTYSRSQAMAIAQDLIERMRANQSASSFYRTAAAWSNPGNPANYPCYAAADAANLTPCAPAAMAVADIQLVSKTTREMLPNGSVLVNACNGAASLTCVTVAWDQTAAAQCNQTQIVDDNRGQNASCVVVEFIP